MEFLVHIDEDGIGVWHLEVQEEKSYKVQLAGG